jgi:hypothetical protein
MHEINGDGYLSSGGHRYFADEDLPTRKATQVTHQWANAVQEEIANVVRAEGITLNSPTESYAQMNQLNTAIDAKVADEASARSAADTTLSGRCTTLEGQMTTETGRNNTQDGQIATLQGQTALFNSTGAVKGDVLSFIQLTITGIQIQVVPLKRGSFVMRRIKVLHQTGILGHNFQSQVFRFFCMVVMQPLEMEEYHKEILSFRQWS